MKKISIIALAALVLAGCGQKKDSQSQAQQAAMAAQPKAQTVKVQPAAKQEVKQDGTYSAQMLLMLLLLSEHASITALSIAAASLRVMERSARKPEG